MKNLVARARRVKLWLQDLARRSEAAGDKDSQIVLVKHGGISHFPIDDWDGTPPRKGTYLLSFILCDNGETKLAEHVLMATVCCL